MILEEKDRIEIINLSNLVIHKITDKSVLL